MTKFTPQTVRNLETVWQGLCTKRFELMRISQQAESEANRPRRIGKHLGGTDHAKLAKLQDEIASRQHEFYEIFLGLFSQQGFREEFFTAVCSSSAQLMNFSDYFIDQLDTVCTDIRHQVLLPDTAS